MKNKKRKKHDCLPAKAIIEAANGNPITIEQALEHFKAYMLFYLPNMLQMNMELHTLLLTKRLIDN